MVIMFSFLVVIFVLFFLALCWLRFEWGVFLFLATLPSYLIRLNYFGLPTTILELMWGAIVFVWLIKYGRGDLVVIKNFIKENKIFTILVGLFFLSSLGGVFISDMWFKSLGQWRAYFFEPVILFFVLIGHWKNLNFRYLICGLLVSGWLVSIVAWLQKISVFFYPPSLWNDAVDGRVTSFFTSPNAVGLFLTPLVPLAILVTIKFYQERKWKLFSVGVVTILVFVGAIFFSFSQGAWIGLGAAFVLGLFLLGYRKFAVVLAILGVIVALVVAPIRTAVLFQDRASQNRLVLWGDSLSYLTRDPGNFVFGAGVRQFFRKIEKPHYDAKVMERLIYPHNIFLNFWTEIGLFGMVSFIGILFFVFRWTIKNKNKILGAMLLAAWTGLVVHGLVDVPYFKNDLAFLFWILVFFSWALLRAETEFKNV